MSDLRINKWLPKFFRAENQLNKLLAEAAKDGVKPAIRVYENEEFLGKGVQSVEVCLTRGLFTPEGEQMKCQYAPCDSEATTYWDDTPLCEHHLSCIKSLVLFVKEESESRPIYIWIAHKRKSIKQIFRKIGWHWRMFWYRWPFKHCTECGKFIFSFHNSTVFCSDECHDEWSGGVPF